MCNRLKWLTLHAAKLKLQRTINARFLLYVKSALWRFGVLKLLLAQKWSKLSQTRGVKLIKVVPEQLLLYRGYQNLPK
jgi:hypothetical protein